MKRLYAFFVVALLIGSFSLSAQDPDRFVYVEDARFQLGDNMEWRSPSYDDSSWQTLSLDKDWDHQGISHNNGVAWYRIHVNIPSSPWRGMGPFKDKVVLDLGFIDDCDETWFNGIRIGKTGNFPSNEERYETKYDVWRCYVVDASLVRWDRDNVIAVRVYNGDGEGGFYDSRVSVGRPSLSDVVSLSVVREQDAFRLEIDTKGKTGGTVKVETDGEVQTKKVKLSPERVTLLHFPVKENRRYTITYSDRETGDELHASYVAPYILTPPAPATPRYNGPLAFGVRPGSPVIIRLAFSGEKPMKYSVEGLPEGVVLDPDKGVLSGSCATPGDYPLVLTATNAKGSTSASFTLKVGSKIALTPPMGWNSWNCWGLSVSQEKVMASAAALINRGLADYGYAYMNIDDAWEAEERNPDGTISPNEKFPDMKGLGDWLHSNGLKLGIYSSPGDRTCGGYLGTLGHERQDAETWASWGVDYLKYDWCGYSKVFNPSKDHSTAAYMRPYMKMQQYLREQPRDIFYSLCQYGMADVWEWGAFVDANSWRTTGDITDTWASLYSIGFEQQGNLYPYAGPGHWNDPDMLVVGKVGWSSSLRDSRLTPDEQYTHISLWSLLAANMLIGCPIDQIDDFTFNLLCNNEVNAVNQDILGRQARCADAEDGMQVWMRELYDGGKAIGIFNLNGAPVPVFLKGALERINVKADTARDLRRQQDIATDATYVIPSHGVLYVKVL